MNYELSLLNCTSPFLNTPNVVSKLKCLESSLPILSFR